MQDNRPEPGSEAAREQQQQQQGPDQLVRGATVVIRGYRYRIKSMGPRDIRLRLVERVGRDPKQLAITARDWLESEGSRYIAVMFGPDGTPYAVGRCHERDAYNLVMGLLEEYPGVVDSIRQVRPDLIDKNEEEESDGQ
jgi:hypothetical protein